MAVIKNKSAKVSTKIVSGLHASIDELAAANPEALTALATILSALMSTDTAVSVSTKGGKTKPKAKVVEEDELDDEDDADDLDDSEDDEEAEGDDLDDADEEEGEEEEGSAGIDLDDLDADTIRAAFEAFEAEDAHERVNAKAGLRELSAEVEDFGFEASAILKAAKAKTPAEKKEAFVTWLSSIHTALDAIMEFEMSDVVDAVTELSGEDFKPKGRAAAAKELSAASELFKLAMAAAE